MLDNTDGFKKSSHDQAVEGRIVDHCRRFDIDPLTAVKHFPVLARRQWLKRFLAHAELFRRSADVPGDIAEIGVFRGLGLFTWANLLECYCIGNRTKTVWGFDNGRGFAELSHQDGAPNASIGKVAGGFAPARYGEELDSAVAIFDCDRFIPQKPRIRFVDGDVEKTVPEFVVNNPGVRFSLVHFDCDLYTPTKAALQALWPRISNGGIVIFDEYAIADWPGETAAVDEILPNAALRSFDWTNAPAAYLVKG